MTIEKFQSVAFEQTAREPGCDDDPDRFEQRAGKLIKHKTADKPE